MMQHFQFIWQLSRLHFLFLRKPKLEPLFNYCWIHNYLTNNFFPPIDYESQCKVIAMISDKNLVFRLWMKISSSPIQICKLSEYKKLVEIAIIQVLGSAEDERNFINLTLMKN